MEIDKIGLLFFVIFLGFLMIFPMIKYEPKSNKFLAQGKPAKLFNVLSRITYIVLIVYAVFILLFFSLFASWLKLAIILPLFTIYLILMWKLRKDWSLRKSEKRDARLSAYAFITMIIFMAMNFFIIQL